MIQLNTAGCALTATAKTAFTALAPTIRINVEVQFAGSGAFTSIGDYALSVEGTAAQRLELTNEPGAQVCNVDLDNGAGLFSPTVFGTAFNGPDQGDGMGGNLRKGRRARVSVDAQKPDGNWEGVCLFTGTVASWTPREQGGARRCTLKLLDALDKARNTMAPDVVLENMTLASACAYVLASGLGLDSSQYNVASCTAVCAYIRLDSDQNCLDALAWLSASRLGSVWADELGLIRVNFELDNGQDGTSRFDFSSSGIGVIAPKTAARGDELRLLSRVEVVSTPLSASSGPELIYKDLEHGYNASSKKNDWIFDPGATFPASGPEFWGGYNCFSILDASLSYLLESDPSTVFMVNEGGNVIGTGTWRADFAGNDQSRFILKNTGSATATVTRLEVWGRAVRETREMRAVAQSQIDGDEILIPSDLISSMDNLKKVAGFALHRCGSARAAASMQVRNFLVPWLQPGDRVTASAPNVLGSGTNAFIVRGKRFRITGGELGCVFVLEQADPAPYVYNPAASAYGDQSSADMPGVAISQAVVIGERELGEDAVGSAAIQERIIEANKIALYTLTSLETDGSTIVNYRMTPFINGAGWQAQLRTDGNLGFRQENHDTNDKSMYLGPNWSTGSGGAQIIRAGMVKQSSEYLRIGWGFNAPTMGSATNGYVAQWSSINEIKIYKWNGAALTLINGPQAYNHAGAEVVFEIIVPSKTTESMYFKADGELIFEITDSTSRAGYWGFGTYSIPTGTYITFIARAGMIEKYDTDASIINNNMIPENLWSFGKFEANAGAGCSVASGADDDMAAGWRFTATGTNAAITLSQGGLDIDDFHAQLYTTIGNLCVASNNNAPARILSSGETYTARCYMRKSGAGNPNAQFILAFTGYGDTSIASYYYSNATGVFSSGAASWAETSAVWVPKCASFMVPANAARVKITVKNYIPTADSRLDITAFQLARGKFTASTMPPYTTGRLDGRNSPGATFWDSTGLRFVGGTHQSGFFPDSGLVIQNWGTANRSQVTDAYQLLAHYEAASGWQMISFDGVIPTGAFVSTSTTYPNFLDLEGAVFPSGAHVRFFDASRSSSDTFMVKGQDGDVVLTQSGLYYTGLRSNLRNSMARFGISLPAGITATADYWYVLTFGGTIYRISKATKQVDCIATSVSTQCGCMTNDGAYIYAVDAVGVKVKKYTLTGTGIGSAAGSLIRSIAWKSASSGGHFIVTDSAYNTVREWVWDNPAAWGTTICGTATAIEAAYRPNGVPSLRGVEYRPETGKIYLTDYVNYFIHRVNAGTGAREATWIAPMQFPQDIFVMLNAGNEEEEMFCAGIQFAAVGVADCAAVML